MQAAFAQNDRSHKNTNTDEKQVVSMENRMKEWNFSPSNATFAIDPWRGNNDENQHQSYSPFYYSHIFCRLRKTNWSLCLKYSLWCATRWLIITVETVDLIGIWRARKKWFHSGFAWRRRKCFHGKKKKISCFLAQYWDPCINRWRAQKKCMHGGKEADLFLHMEGYRKWITRTTCGPSRFSGRQQRANWWREDKYSWRNQTVKKMNIHGEMFFPRVFAGASSASLTWRINSWHSCEETISRKWTRNRT